MGKKSNAPCQLEGTMQLKTMQRTEDSTNAVFIWRIKDYDKLKYDRIYYYIYEDQTFYCVFKLFLKKNLRLHVAARCNYTKAYAKFYVYNGLDNSSNKLMNATEIESGLYVADFVDNFLILEDGICRDTGLLTIAFRIRRSFTMTTRYTSYYEAGELSDLNDLCHDIQTIYIESEATDFVIKVADLRIKAHKSVLYARSEFFKEYFEKDNEIDDCEIPEAAAGIMHQVLLYIYSGELPDLSVKCMIKVLEIAYLLKIPSLKDRCLKFFDETDSWQCIETVEFFEYEIHE